MSLPRAALPPVAMTIVIPGDCHTCDIGHWFAMTSFNCYIIVGALITMLQLKLVIPSAARNPLRFLETLGDCTIGIPFGHHASVRTGSQ